MQWSVFLAFIFSRTFVRMSALAVGLMLAVPASAQLPGDLPWTGGDCNGTNIILQNGIGALTCGVTTDVPAGERYTFAMFDLDGIIPGSGRSDETSNADVYHHPSWHIDDIGNVYGVAIREADGSVYLTTSTNYGAGFLGQNAVLRFGDLAGGNSSGDNDLAAAGAVYKIDPVTGQASVFANLHQLSTTFTHDDCESSDANTRTNSGVGLGNIAYDPVNDQFFVSNIEDGRIYRLSSSGAVLDSYDPFVIDDGVAGISDLEELVVGLAVEPNGDRLFFGGVDQTNSGSQNSGTGSLPVYSIDLTASGGFSGSVDNTNNPNSGSWDNYTGTETTHATITTGSGFSYGSNYVVMISDLAFNRNTTPDLLVGVRISCDNSWFTSYNHWGETDIVTKNTGTNLYNNSVTELDISELGLAGPDDGYGGVAAYVDGGGNSIIGVSFADILAEEGPHGIAVFDDPPGAGSISPLAAISYGTVDTGDPKGVGGDIEIFTSCIAPPCALTPTINTICNDNGTTNPNDDTYSYTVEIPSTASTGTSYSISGDDTQAGLLFDVVNGPYGPFPISGGSISLTLTDSDDPGCTTTETVSAPAECSDCTLGTPVINTVCNDNGTSDPNDDTFTFTIEVSETGGLGVSYALTGDVVQSGLTYGVISSSFGPFPISGGDLSITITDEGDAACQIVNQTVSAPATCSPTCTFAPVIVATCDDNGTTDPNDDTYSYTINIPSSAGSGASYSITGDDTQAALAYDVTNGPFGPFSISGGDLNITITDDTDGSCNTTEVVSAPAECSDCTLGTPVIVATCDDNGTSDPSDDTFTFTIDVSETGGLGVSYALSGDVVQGGLTYGTVSGPFGPFPISGGDLDITITDEGDPACQLANETVGAPATCSPDCTYNPTIEAICNDNGTTDPNDDTYTYTISLPSTAASGLTFSVSGDDSQSGLLYDVVNGPYGPFLITGGDLNITLTDDSDVTCNSSEVVSAPVECSDCILGTPVILATCDGNGTSDPSDDTFTFTIELNETGGLGVSYALSGDVVQGGLTYGAVSGPFGPFLIASGDLTITITDESDAACQIVNQTVSAPATCSPACDLSPVIVATCNDEGTTNPNDDTYTYTIFVPSEPASGATYSVSGDDVQGGLAYDVINGPYGPFLITGGDLNISITDDTDPSCSTNDVVTAPAECSDCALSGPNIVTVCDNQNTSDPSDDTFTFTIEVNETTGLGATYSITGDVSAGGLAYGVTSSSFGPFLISNGNLTITITDDGDPACQILDATVTAPAACSPPCDLVPTIVSSCNDQGTSNPADDTYSFTVMLPVGSGSIASNGFNISGAETQTGLAYGVTHGPFGNFLISGGDVSITITDLDDPTCSVTETVSAPLACSVPCDLDPMIMASCDDNGTLDPNDDTFSYTITLMSGMGTGSSFAISGDDSQTGLSYDVVNGPFGPFPISGGDLNLTITDEDDATCNGSGVVTAPATCSPDPASIGNYVWEDTNANGVQDDGATGISGVEVTLTGTDIYGASVTQTQFTDPSGFYLFDNLVPGDYKLTFETPAGYEPTDVNQGGDDAMDSDADPSMGGMTVVETLVSGENNLDYDAGYYLPAELGNYTWIDDNVNGQQDGGEDPLPGVTVILTGTTGTNEPVNLTQLTDDDGLYLFDNLQPGTYKVTFQTPNGDFLSTQENQGPDATDSDADPNMGGMTGNYTLASGDSDLTVDAGYYELASIGNFVWEDLDGDGEQDTGEPGIEGVQVTLTGTDVLGNPVTDVTTTDVDGSYIFDDLVPGDYKLTFATPAGYDPTGFDQGGDDTNDSDADPAMGGMTVVETLTSGEDNTDYDAGYYLPAELGNYTWIDENANGTQDLGESPIGGIQVTLSGTTGAGDPVSDVQTTGVDGLYLFTGLQPGTYKVTFGSAGGDYVSTTANDPDASDLEDSDADEANGMTGDYTLESGDSDLSVDAGYYEPASIGDFVWEDTNGNGTQEVGEPGIPDVLITLTGTDGQGNPVSETQMTGPGGDYLFDNLVPGEYKLTFATPATYTTTDVDQGGDDADDSDADPAMGGMTAVEVLTSGEDNTDYDAGYYLPAELGNYTWIDDNLNGQQDGGEMPLPGINVILDGTTGSGETVNESAITDANGLYLFDNLQPGTYKVTFQTPAGDFLSTLVDTGADATDSDADPAMGGMTGNYTLESGDSDLTVDAGYYELASIGNFVWEDTNANGLQDPGEPGIEGVTVELSGTDQFGNPVTGNDDYRRRRILSI
jgi:hypothetical protein